MAAAAARRAARSRVAVAAGGHRDQRERPIATATIKAYTDEIAAAFTRAGATVRDVQRMSLEEIFVANVMLSRKETSA